MAVGLDSKGTKSRLGAGDASDREVMVCEWWFGAAVAVAGQLGGGAAAASDLISSGICEISCDFQDFEDSELFPPLNFVR